MSDAKDAARTPGGADAEFEELTDESRHGASTPAMGAGATSGSMAGEFAAEMSGRSASLWSDAWHDLRRSPVFVAGGVVILALVVLALIPGVFTSHPAELGFCRTENRLDAPSGSHWFGYDNFGCDVYVKAIYATRNSLLVGVLASSGVLLVGGVMGVLAGYYGRKLDAVLMRVTDMFFGIPIILGGLVLLSMIATGNAYTVALVLTVFAWPAMARIVRSTVISAKNMDYVQAARALGAGDLRIIRRHVLPNALAPAIVVATINLGIYIAAEAALSFLGVGIRHPEVSWGLMISDAQQYLRIAPHALLFPAAFLSVTVLSFILVGDAVRDALDPKLR